MRRERRVSRLLVSPEMGERENFDPHSSVNSVKMAKKRSKMRDAIIARHERKPFPIPFSPRVSGMDKSSPDLVRRNNRAGSWAVSACPPEIHLWHKLNFSPSKRPTILPLYSELQLNAATKERGNPGSAAGAQEDSMEMSCMHNELAVAAVRRLVLCNSVVPFRSNKCGINGVMASQENARRPSSLHFHSWRCRCC